MRPRALRVLYPIRAALLVVVLGLWASATPARASYSGKRGLLQQQQEWTYGNKTADETYALVESMLPEPPFEWFRNATITDDMDLRAEICRTQGNGMADVNMADPLLGCMGQETSTLTPAPTVDLTGLNLNNVQLDLPSLGTPAPTFPMEPSSVEISLEADIRLGGIPLPEIIGEVKINGTCHFQKYRAKRPCRIFAVDERCCRCSSMGTAGTEMCPDCKKGLEVDTQPFKIAPGGRLWLYNVEICAGRTTSDGGSVILQQSSVNASWLDISVMEDASFLHAEDVKFTKGYADGHGGTLAVKQGGVAVLIRPEFEQNFAASTGEGNRTSNDVDVESGGIVILYQADPGLVDMSVGESSQPSTADGEFYVRYLPPPPPLPPAPPPPSPPPPDVLKELQKEQVKLVEINVTDLDQKSSSPEKPINLTLVISIAAGAVSGLALVIAACCLLKPKQKAEYSMTALGSPDSDPSDPSIFQRTPSAMLSSNNKHQSYKAGSRKAKTFSGIGELLRPKKKQHLGGNNTAEIAAYGKAGGMTRPGTSDGGKDPKSASSNAQQPSDFMRPVSAASGSTFRKTRPVSAVSLQPVAPESSRLGRVKAHDSKIEEVMRVTSARSAKQASFKKAQPNALPVEIMAAPYARACSAPPKRPPSAWGADTDGAEHNEAGPGSWGFLPADADHQHPLGSRSMVLGTADTIEALSWLPPPDPDLGYFTTNLFNKAKTRAVTGAPPLGHRLGTAPELTGGPRGSHEDGHVVFINVESSNR